MLGRGMSDQSLERAGSVYWLVGPTASRTTPLHSVALRVTNASINILLLEPIIPIDNPHRGSGESLYKNSISDHRIRLGTSSKCVISQIGAKFSRLREFSHRLATG